MSHDIVYLVGQLGAGGLERQLYVVLKNLDRARYRPAVAVWRYSESDWYVPRLRDLAVPVYSLGDGNRLSRWWQLRRLVKRSGARLLHSYGFYTNFIAYVCARTLRGVRAVGAVRSNFVLDRAAAGPIVGRLSARWPRTQVFNNRAAIDAARAAGGPYVPRTCCLIRNGVDLEAFRSTPVPPGDRAVIAAVGSLLPLKRWDRLITAVARLRDRGVPVEVRLAGEGPQRSALERQIREQRLEQHVTLLGNIDDVPGLLAASSFAVHVSDVEGCPNAVIEAMSAGRAVIATNVGDVPALIDDGVDGFIVPVGDEDTLVERMARLASAPRVQAAMGTAARRKAEREFATERTIRDHFAAYAAAGWREN